MLLLWARSWLLSLILPRGLEPGLHSSYLLQALGSEWLSNVCTDPQVSCLVLANLLALRAKGGLSPLCSLLGPAPKCQGPATW